MILRDIGEHFLADEARVYRDALRNGAEALLVIAGTVRERSREINRERRFLEHDADLDGRLLWEVFREAHPDDGASLKASQLDAGGRSPATQNDKNGRPMPVRADRDRPVQWFFEATPREKLEEALEGSDDPQFFRLYDALQDPAYRNTNLSTLCRRFGVSLKDLVKLWIDYNVALGMLYMANLLPEIMKQTAEDALRGDCDSRRLAFEIAGLMGRNKASTIAIQQNIEIPASQDVVSDVCTMDPDS